jgi:hypothetical protein
VLSEEEGEEEAAGPGAGNDNLEAVRMGSGCEGRGWLTLSNGFLGIWLSAMVASLKCSRYTIDISMSSKFI